MLKLKFLNPFYWLDRYIEKLYPLKTGEEIEKEVRAGHDASGKKAVEALSSGGGFLH